MAKPTHNFLGELVGTLLVIERLGIRRDKLGHTRCWWKCYCSGCHREYEKPTETLVARHGCASCSLRKPNRIALSIFNRYQNDARKRKHIFALTFEQFLILCSQNCHYCGVPPQQVAKLSYLQTSKHDNRIWLYNGIDQITAGSGYTTGNCVTCCVQCNVSKSDRTAAEFIEHCFRVSKRFAGAL